MGAVVAQLVVDPHQNEDAGGNAQRETENVDGAIDFVALDGSERHEEVVFEHGLGVLLA